MSIKRITISLLIVFFAINISYSQGTSKKASSKWKKHVELGVPIDSDSSDDFLIKRSQYVLSYNADKNVANWVSWNLNKKWYGKAKRWKGSFFKDPLLPSGVYKVKHSDYTNSGYNRGHMVRSEERTKTVTDNKSTFYLTNVLPQTEDLNQRLWLDLEYYCESLCKDSAKELYVIAGGVFHSGDRIDGVVSIPDSCFKIIVVLEKGEGLSDVNANTEVIAVMMPNKDGLTNFNWEHYTTSIDRIEQSTGYDFLIKIDEEVQRVIESKVY